VGCVGNGAMERGTEEDVIEGSKKRGNEIQFRDGL